MLEFITCKCVQYALSGSFFFFFLELHLQHMGVPRLGVQLELQLPAYATATATATATWDLSCIYNLHHSSQQRQDLNPLSEARDRTCVLMDPSHC